MICSSTQIDWLSKTFSLSIDWGSADQPMVMLPPCCGVPALPPELPPLLPPLDPPQPATTATAQTTSSRAGSGLSCDAPCAGGRKYPMRCGCRLCGEAMKALAAPR